MVRNFIYGLVFFTIGVFAGNYNARFHYKFLKEIKKKFFLM